MAAVTLLGSATFNTTNGSKAVTATPAVGDLIVIVVAHSGNTSNVAPTDNKPGGTYTRADTCVKASSADTMQVWIRDHKIAAAASTVFTHNPGTTSGGGLAVLKVTGMSRSGAAAERQSAIQSNVATGTPTPVLGSAALTGNPLVGAVFCATNSTTTQTPRSSPAWTERFDNGYNTPTTGLEVASIDSGETATSIAWGGASGSAFCSIVVELDASAAPETWHEFEAKWDDEDYQEHNGSTEPPLPDPAEVPPTPETAPLEVDEDVSLQTVADSYQQQDNDHDIMQSVGDDGGECEELPHDGSTDALAVVVAATPDQPHDVASEYVDDDSEAHDGSSTPVDTAAAADPAIPQSFCADVDDDDDLPHDGSTDQSALGLDNGPLAASVDPEFVDDDHVDNDGGSEPNSAVSASAPDQPRDEVHEFVEDDEPSHDGSTDAIPAVAVDNNIPQSVVDDVVEDDGLRATVDGYQQSDNAAAPDPDIPQSYVADWFDDDYDHHEGSAEWLLPDSVAVAPAPPQSYVDEVAWDGDDDIDVSDDYDNTQLDEAFGDAADAVADDVVDNEIASEPVTAAVAVDPNIPQSFVFDDVDDDGLPHDGSTDALAVVVDPNIAQSFDAQWEDDDYVEHEGSTDAQAAVVAAQDILFETEREFVDDDYDEHNGSGAPVEASVVGPDQYVPFADGIDYVDDEGLPQDGESYWLLPDAAALLEQPQSYADETQQVDGDDDLDVSDDFDNSLPDEDFGVAQDVVEDDPVENEIASEPVAPVIDPNIPQSFADDGFEADELPHDGSTDALAAAPDPNIPQSFDAVWDDEDYVEHNGSTDALAIVLPDNNIQQSFDAVWDDEDYVEHNGSSVPVDADSIFTGTERVLIIEAENRRIAIDAESRNITIQAEDRTIIVQPEPRSLQP